MKNLVTKQRLLVVITLSIFAAGCEQNYSITAKVPNSVVVPPITTVIYPSPTATPVPIATPIPAPSATPPCQPTLNTTTANLRIMFMVDNSGSTAGWGGTDPNFVYRAKAIQTFLNQYSTKTNFTYSFGYFNGTTARVYDMTSRTFKKNSAPVPFGNTSQLSAALTTYQQQTPNDDTPYEAAFSAVQTEVSQDEVLNGTKYKYVLVFMSDGQPTDLNVPIQTSIRSLVANLNQAAGTNRLSISAVYFGPDDDSDSIRNLSFMASDGSGQFVDTNHTTVFSINDVITVPGPPHCN